jgi:phosphoglycolate phosphatase-like HAD superfamily hydrolase
LFVLGQTVGKGNHLNFTIAAGTGNHLRTTIFDVEGTLVDCVPQTLESWRETLAHFGLSFSTEQLQKFSGMDGGAMLDVLLRGKRQLKSKKEILREQGERYRSKFLSTVKPFPGIPDLFKAVKESGCRIGLATTCQPDELRHYRSIMNVGELIDAVACGEDAKRGKPEPDLHLVALRRLDASAREALAIGDTPYDAIAARNAQIAAIVGTLTGVFSASELRAAGCAVVLNQPADLTARITAAAL